MRPEMVRSPTSTRCVIKTMPTSSPALPSGLPMPATRSRPCRRSRSLRLRHNKKATAQPSLISAPNTTCTWQTAVRNAYKIVTYLDNLRMKWWYLWSPGPRLAWFTPKGNLQLKPQYYMLKFVVATLPAGIQMVQTDNPDISAGIVNKNGGKEARILVVNWSTNE